MTPSSLRSLFRLEDDVIFLNHGSFGATPRAVMRAANRYRKQMERQPVRFMQRELPELLIQSRDRLAAYVGAAGDDVAFVPNATFGVNLIARSLGAQLRPGDEVLSTDHEYGACSNAWESACARAGARYVRAPIPLPDETGAEEHAPVDALWAKVTDRTRVLFLSHITSPTALRLPVEELIQRARTQGILTVIDGAHAPGQIALALETLGADAYTGNCHKWLCAPKGAGFLYVRREQQHWVEPLVVSWGSEPERQFRSGSDFQDALCWSGTNDFSPYLAVADAIAFQEEHNWDCVRAQCAARIDQWLPRLAAAAKTHDLYAYASALRPPQMAILPLRPGTEATRLKRSLYEQHRIEIPVIEWRGRVFVRLSVQGYTTDAEIAALERALCEA